MRPFRATCVLDDGRRIVLHFIARGTFAAIDLVFDTYGDALRVCSVRRA